MVPDADAVIRSRALELDAPLETLGKDFEPLEGSELGVLGRHQPDNAGLVLACVERLLGGFGDAAGREAARAGIARAELPGRIEQLESSPRVIVDSAHTRSSAGELAAVVEALGPDFARRRLLLSVSDGKDVASILDTLLPFFDEAFVTRAEPHRSIDAPLLAQRVREHRPEIEVHSIDDPAAAAREARAASGEDDLLVAAGSLYLAAVARAHWRRNTR